MKVKIKQFGNTREPDAGERTFWYQTPSGNKAASSMSLNQDLYLKWLDTPYTSRGWDKDNDIFKFKKAVEL
jgi:hypothetical protein